MARKTAARKRKIAILGTTPSRMDAPLGEKDWEIWTIGPGGKDAHRWDLLFEVHGTWPENFKDYLNDLSNVKLPQKVVSLVDMKKATLRWALDHGKSDAELAKEITGDWSSNILYPKEEIFDKYQRRMWFSSSISYCLALAIEQQPSDIGCFGIDLESGEEYVSQFVGCAHFLDLARLAGINLHIPSGCGLLRDPNPYPDRYETDFALTLEKKGSWLTQQLQMAEAQFEDIKGQTLRKEGELLFIRSKAMDCGQAEKDLMALQHQLGSLAATINQLKGEKSATDFYRSRYVIGIRDPS